MNFCIDCGKPIHTNDGTGNAYYLDDDGPFCYSCYELNREGEES